MVQINLISIHRHSPNTNKQWPNPFFDTNLDELWGLPLVDPTSHVMKNLLWISPNVHLVILPSERGGASHTEFHVITEVSEKSISGIEHRCIYSTSREQATIYWNKGIWLKFWTRVGLEGEIVHDTCLESFSSLSFDVVLLGKNFDPVPVSILLCNSSQYIRPT